MIKYRLALTGGCSTGSVDSLLKNENSLYSHTKVFMKLFGHCTLQYFVRNSFEHTPEASTVCYSSYKLQQSLLNFILTDAVMNIQLIDILANSLDA